jgi:thiamine biosynthesis protein ThiS
MKTHTITANGKEYLLELPCTIHEFLIARELPSRSVVVEHNGEATPPSEFTARLLSSGDKLEIVRIVAGG